MCSEVWKCSSNTRSHGTNQLKIIQGVTLTGKYHYFWVTRLSIIISFILVGSIAKKASAEGHLWSQFFFQSSKYQIFIQYLILGAYIRKTKPLTCNESSYSFAFSQFYIPINWTFFRLIIANTIIKCSPLHKKQK